MTAGLFAQESSNCFLDDFQPRRAVTPAFEPGDPVTEEATVTAFLDAGDTLGSISRYLFGNAWASWVGNNITDPVLLSHLNTLSPTLVRYPGGSWADIFFWDGKTFNVPRTLVNGTNGQEETFTPYLGRDSWTTTVDRYYMMRRQIDAQGLITINYGYARYGTGLDPVEEAADYAADWVIYDAGRTRFWEIGNENYGPWEAGWRIDTQQNKDGQPQVITGALYGQHFRIFAERMREAATSIGATIYVGGQILPYDGKNSWNIAERDWNEGFFGEAGETPDFYVIHNYFGNSANVRSQLDAGSKTTQEMMDFIRSDIANQGAADRPVALTEWNMDQSGGQAGWSTITGMQAVIALCEMMNAGYGMSCRWLIANWEEDGMFYHGDDPNVPEWNPHPDFYYLSLLQRFTGDHAINAGSDNTDVQIYASTFQSGHIGLVCVNKGRHDQVVQLDAGDAELGSNYYLYTLQGENNWVETPLTVQINGRGADDPAWGPLDDFENIPAWSFPVEEEVTFDSPARSVQFLLFEGHPVPGSSSGGKLFNYPNPFKSLTTIGFTLLSDMHVTVKIFDILGRRVRTLMTQKFMSAGPHEINFDAGGLPGGIYVCRIEGAGLSDSVKLLLIK